MVHLKSEGTVPEEREAFMMVVIGLIRISMFSFNMLVGMGSKSHDFVPEDRIIFLTKFSLTSSKMSIVLPVNVL